MAKRNPDLIVENCLGYRSQMMSATVLLAEVVSKLPVDVIGVDEVSQSGVNDFLKDCSEKESYSIEFIHVLTENYVKFFFFLIFLSSDSV